MSVLTKTKRKMAALIKARENDLATCQRKIEEARAAEAEAVAAMDRAMDALDPVAYAEAAKKKDAAQLSIRMYSDKAQKVNNIRMTTEAESDAVIDSLLEYERQLSDDLDSAVMEPLKALAALYNDYMAAVADVENTIRNWTAKIHPNYRNDSTTYPDGTHRSPTPLPVHAVEYDPGATAHAVGALLKALDRLL